MTCRNMPEWWETLDAELAGEPAPVSRGRELQPLLVIEEWGERVRAQVTGPGADRLRPGHYRLVRVSP